jgi:hypothetical protein
MAEIKNLIESAVARKPVDFKELVGEMLESKIDSAIDAYIDDVTENVMSDAQLDEFKVHFRADDADNKSNAKKLAAHLKKRGISATTERTGWHTHTVHVHSNDPAHKAYVKHKVGKRYDTDVREGEEFDDLEGMEYAELEEVSKGRLAKYVAKASSDNAYRGTELGQARAKSDGSGKSYQHQSNLITKMHKRQNGINTAARKLATEGSEDISDILDQLDEVSKERLGAYINRAASSMGGAMAAASKGGHDDPKTYAAVGKYQKRKAGINRAVNKLTKEETEEFDLEDFLESLSEEELNAILEDLKSIDTDGLTEEEIAEVSNDRLRSYVDRAWNGGNSQAHHASIARSHKDKIVRSQHAKKADNRDKGASLALSKLGGRAKVNASESEEIDDILDQLDEVSQTRLRNYMLKAKDSMAAAQVDTHKAYAGNHVDDAKGQASSKKYAKRWVGMNTAIHKATDGNVKVPGGKK